MSPPVDTLQYSPATLLDRDSRELATGEAYSAFALARQLLMSSPYAGALHYPEFSACRRRVPNLIGPFHSDGVEAESRVSVKEKQVGS